MPNPISQNAKIAWLMGREALPTHLRLFGDVFANDRSTVTEKDFTQEELDVMKNLIQQKNADDVQRANLLTDELEQTTTMINNLFDDMVGEATTKEQKAKLEEDRIKALDRYQAQVDSYLSTANRTNINYNDYLRNEANLNTMNEGSWFDMLNPDAQQRVLNSIGRFSAQAGKDGNVNIEDYYAMDLTPSDVIKEGSYNPRDIVEAIAYAVNPSYERKIDVTIPNVDWTVPDEYWNPKEPTGLESTIK